MEKKRNRSYSFKKQMPMHTLFGYEVRESSTIYQLKNINRKMFEILNFKLVHTNFSEVNSLISIVRMKLAK